MNKTVVTAVSILIEAGIDLLAGESRKRESEIGILMD
jgi:hypothetical protein